MRPGRARPIREDGEIPGGDWGSVARGAGKETAPTGGPRVQRERGEQRGRLGWRASGGMGRRVAGDWAANVWAVWVGKRAAG